MPLPPNIKKILLPRFDTLGDIVLLEPFLRALHEVFLGVEITLLVREGYDQLASLFPSYLNWQAWRISPYSGKIEIVVVKDLLNRLENEHWDLILFTKYERTWIEHMIAAKFNNIPQMAIGKMEEIPVWLKSYFIRCGIEPRFTYGELIPVEERTQESEKYQILLDHLTRENRILPPPKLRVPGHIKRVSRAVLQSLKLDKKNFCVCLPAGIENILIKVWPAERFAEVITWLNHKHGIYTLLIGHENERGIVEKVASISREKGYNPTMWLGKNGEIPVLAGILEEARFYFGNDTGPMHIGAALGIPIVALFGGGTWPRFIPNGSKCHVIVRQMPCFYCEWKCSFRDAPCIQDLPLSIVQKALQIVLKKDKSNGNGVFIHEVKAYPKMVNEFIQKAGKIFQEVEADRAARLEVINEQGRRLGELEGERNNLCAELEGLRQKFEFVEADRAARLEMINTLNERLQASENDRAARLEVIERQAKEFGEKLGELEADRAVRLEVINEQGRRLGELEGERNNLFAELEGLRQKFEFVEADRALRLGVIEQQAKELERVRSTLEIMKSSRSWRMTAPFRWIHERLISRGKSK